MSHPWAPFLRRGPLTVGTRLGHLACSLKVPSPVTLAAGSLERKKRFLSLPLRGSYSSVNGSLRIVACFPLPPISVSV